VSAVTEQILQDAQRFTWIAKHLTKSVVGFGIIDVIYIDDGGCPHDITIPFTDEMKLQEMDDVDVLRFAVDFLVALEKVNVN
jgi:hypothetical protein